ncbi:hypothetical protein GCM10007858_01460 [Bradyrhizobium liaoningense]|nr:hypothetical protein GCM10007858_01460 [Bradyrhizobium liaoningense]
MNEIRPAKHSVVMPGLVPGIHVFRQSRMRVDGRDKPGHDGESYGFFSAACGRPKSGAAESWPISTMPRRMARVRVK